jgi:hypothetical protein
MEVDMPHSCLGALTYHYHGLVGFLVSDDAIRLVEATAAGGAVYRFTWAPLKKVLRAVIFILIASVAITALQRSEVSTFTHRMRPCYRDKVPYLQSPEPIKISPNRDANAYPAALSAA